MKEHLKLPPTRYSIGKPVEETARVPDETPERAEFLWERDDGSVAHAEFLTQAQLEDLVRQLGDETPDAYREALGRMRQRATRAGEASPPA